MTTAVRSHPLSGATVLLCGATGGIGSALARELHCRGAVLTLAGRDVARLADLPVPGDRAVRDLRSPEACVDVVALAAARTGGIDVMINASGVVAFGSAAELAPAAMDEMMRINTLAAMMLSRSALGVLRPGGAIVNISGVIAERNLPGMAAYGASKAAVRAFDEALAREARRTGLRVIDARPPHTETGLASRAIAGEAPAMPAGIAPERVATVICDALEEGARDLPSEAF